MITNLGGRKAVLSSIRLDRFVNQEGETIYLPGASGQHSGNQWTQRSGWVNGAFQTENFRMPGPWVLEPDDVIVIRFRTRRGLNWDKTWVLPKLSDFCVPLRSPVVTAHGGVTWRRAEDIVRENFKVDLRVEQQEKYVALVDALTQGFTVLPSVPIQVISD